MHCLGKTLILVFLANADFFEWGILCSFKIFLAIYMYIYFSYFTFTWILYYTLMLEFEPCHDFSKSVWSQFLSQNLKIVIFKQINIARPWLLGISVFHCTHIYIVSSVGCDHIKTEKLSSLPCCFARPKYQLKQFNSLSLTYLIN